MATLDTLTEQKPLRDFTENAYLNYSMYVIMDRALPHIGDGLKPVQRRIIYAMSELGLKSTSKFKKSARTVGDVLGKYHPHGDSACYEAMVLMAQTFAYRYPLIEGQGNFGSPDDPKSFAAMRYTEARLSKYAEVLLAELDQGTVDWKLNFDGTMQEPILLPARLPNLLLNGTTGIAVGMATDVPPHNLTEIAKACIYLIENADASVSDLCKIVKGPDFPTRAEIITPAAEIREMYKTGQGSIRARAVYTMEDDDIVITALPHQISGSKILEQIAAQMQAKKLPMIEDLRDESDHENPTRLVIVPKSNRVDVEQVMTHLFATTGLENTYRVNFNVIGLDNRPRVKNLLDLLNEWLEFRIEVTRKRLQFRLERVDERLHVLAGLLIVYLNLDEVIKIIRKEDEPRPVLMKRFQLSEIQADAILDTKLRHLAKLEEMKIRGEQAELEKEKAELEKNLSSKQRMKALIKKELETDIEKLGDKRMSPIVAREQAQAMREEDVLPQEAVTVVLSEKGWVRVAKSHEFDITKLSYKGGDAFQAAIKGQSHQLATFMDSTGRTYSIPAHTLPSARGYGEPLSGKINPPAGAHFVGVTMGEDADLYLLSSDAGYGFIAPLSELISKNRNGKAMINVPKESRALPFKRIEDVKKQKIAAITNEGRVLIFPLADLPQLNKGKGNKIIQIPPARNQAREEFVVDVLVLSPNESIVLYAGKRSLTLKPADLKHFYGARGQRGLKLPRGLQRVERAEKAE